MFAGSTSVVSAAPGPGTGACVSLGTAVTVQGSLLTWVSEPCRACTGPALCVCVVLHVQG